TRVTTLAFSSDGRRLVSADRDGRTYVWPVPDRDASAGAWSALKPLASCGHDGQPVTVARFLDTQTVVTGTGDLAKQRWHADPDLMNETAIPWKFTRFDLAARPETRPLEQIPIARESTGPENPLGVITAAVSPGDGR